MQKDDVIYRQAAINALDKRFDSVPMEQTTEILLLRRDLRDLPPAESEHKTGKWIATYSDCGGDVFIWVSWKCSNCGYVRKKGWKNTDDGKKPDALFCEMCGVDMIVE